MRSLGSGNRRIMIVLATLFAVAVSGGAMLAMATSNSVSGPRAGKPVAPSPGTGLNSGHFDDLTAEVPDEPGVDGRTGTDEPASADVPVDGATKGPKVIKTGRVGAVNGIPRGVFKAYRMAAANLAKVRPGCGLTWPLLAGIGKVESGHAAGGKVNKHGTTRGTILGPLLNGSPGLGKVRDTDDGKLDKHTLWDRPVGPMQIVPAVWHKYAVDGNGDDNRSPNNVYDATATVGVYLCAQEDDLRNPRDLVRALLRYNHSRDFVSTVLRWMRLYSDSAVTVPNRPGIIPGPKADGNAERKDDPRKVPDVPDKDTPTPEDSRPPEPSDPTRPTDPTMPTEPTRPTTSPTHDPTTPRPTTPRPTPTTTRPTPTKPTTPTPTPTTTTPTPTPSNTPPGSPSDTPPNSPSDTPPNSPSDTPPGSPPL